MYAIVHRRPMNMTCVWGENRQDSARQLPAPVRQVTAGRLIWDGVLLAPSTANGVGWFHHPKGYYEDISLILFCCPSFMAVRIEVRFSIF